MSAALCGLRPLPGHGFRIRRIDVQKLTTNPVPVSDSHKQIQGDHLLRPSQQVETAVTNKTFESGDASEKSRKISSTKISESGINSTLASHAVDVHKQPASDTSSNTFSNVAPEVEPAVSHRAINQSQQPEVDLPTASGESQLDKMASISMADQLKAHSTVGPTAVSTTAKMMGNMADPFGITSQIEVATAPAFESQLRNPPSGSPLQSSAKRRTAQP